MTFQFSNHENEPTKFCFLFGTNLLGSPSPKMHNFWFKNNSLNYEYKNYIVHKPHEFIRILRKLKNDPKFLGGNVTMPFKQTLVKSFRDVFRMSQTVKNTASANTLFRDENGNFEIENTDVVGIQKTIDVLCPNNIFFKNIVIYGAGGSSASCIFSVFEKKITHQVICLSRDPDKSIRRFRTSKFLDTLITNQKLVLRKLERNFLPVELDFDADATNQDACLIINTLPLGQTEMYEESNDFCISLLKKRNPKNTFFFDLVYDNTDAYITAKLLGIPCENGTLMFKTQAAESFRLWTGIDPTYQQCLILKP